ncbi:MAG: geranylgeranylglyceryl/heptaprenylglyceryl phosphate synthase [Calditrichia bacterium]
MQTRIYTLLKQRIAQNGSIFVFLIDPDKMNEQPIEDTLPRLAENGVDVIFIGGTLLLQQNFDEVVRKIKTAAGSLPVILFPGSVYQISAHADALLFLSVISGRNPAHLIENQVLAAPIIWQKGIEPISCAYLLVESGQMTSAEFMSNSRPLPRNKPDLALAHALAAEYLGFKLIYLEAGSGARLSVPEEMITAVSHAVSLPVIVGGGIRTPEEAAKKSRAGASLVVVGNYFENGQNLNKIKEFAEAIHQRK